jgi:transcriptional regulator with GAF, ATPase, and Fis domain
VLSHSTHPGAPSSTLTPARMALFVVYPPELAGQVIELLPGLTIGREPTVPPGAEAGSNGRAALPVALLPHATVSRRHCAIDGLGAPLLVDLGSSNGTKLNGAALSGRAPLPPQSVVRIGDVLAVVDELGTASAPSTPALPGAAPAVARAREALGRAVSAAAPGLVLGETGTGKERVAAEIHRLRGRPGPYVKFSCAEFARELVESQLFGYERGAFTGAQAPQKGLFAAADGGTLFLDEIGELALDLQAKLLRVLQEGEVRPLGSLATHKVDVQVVAATNRELADEVERGAFRRDLYARLSFFELRLPPLRARRQDLFFWIERLCADFVGPNRAGSAPFRLRADAAELVLLHAWPENLRGLDRFVHRVLTLGERVVGRRALASVMPELLPEPLAAGETGAGSTPPDAAFGEADGQGRPSDRPSREQFVAVYEATGRNVYATSKHFGKDRRQIYRWLELFGIAR